MPSEDKSLPVSYMSFRTTDKNSVSLPTADDSRSKGDKSITHNGRFFRNSNCIIGVDNNGGQGKGYPNPDQAFQVDFNELLFTSTALQLIKDAAQFFPENKVLVI